MMAAVSRIPLVACRPGRLPALACALALAVSCAAVAGRERADDRTVSGRVTRVSDGDTVWLQPGEGGRPMKIRIEGIDAPERCQPWGLQATEALRGRLLGQPLQATLRGQDDYRRWLGRLEHEGTDVGAWMVQQGHAWSYRYRHSAGSYRALQAQARQAGRGLFSEPDPMPPDVFRRWHGPCD